MSGGRSGYFSVRLMWFFLELLAKFVGVICAVGLKSGPKIICILGCSGGLIRPLEAPFPHRLLVWPWTKTWNRTLIPMCLCGNQQKPVGYNETHFAPSGSIGFTCVIIKIKGHRTITEDSFVLFWQKQDVEPKAQTATSFSPRVFIVLLTPKLTVVVWWIVPKLLKTAKSNIHFLSFCCRPRL